MRNTSKQKTLRKLAAGSLIAACSMFGTAGLAMAEDGGFWALALRDPAHGAVLRAVPMSQADTGARTAAALAARGLGVAYGPVLRDVDTVTDAVAVANDVPDRLFAAAVRRYLPAEGDALTRRAS